MQFADLVCGKFPGGGYLPARSGQCGDRGLQVWCSLMAPLTWAIFIYSLSSHSVVGHVQAALPSKIQIPTLHLFSLPPSGIELS